MSQIIKYLYKYCKFVLEFHWWQNVFSLSYENAKFFFEALDRTKTLPNTVCILSFPEEPPDLLPQIGVFQVDDIKLPNHAVIF